MIKEFFKIKNYVKVRWHLLVAGIFFTILSVFANGVSLSAIVPLMDKVLVKKEKIILPENLPQIIKIKIEPLIFKINQLPSLLLLKYLLIFLITILFLKGLFFYLQNYFYRCFSTRLLTDVRELLYTKIMSLSDDFFAKKQTGELTTRIIYDVNLLNVVFESFFPKFVFPILLTFSYFVIIFTIDWKMSLLSIFMFPVILYPVFKMGNKLRKLGKKIQIAYGEIGNVINESVYGQQIIKVYNREEYMKEKFKKENENIFKNVISMVKRLLIISPFTEFAGAVASSGLIYYGAVKIINGGMSTGFLFLFFVALLSMISPLKGIGETYGLIKQASSALPRVFSVLDTESSVVEEGKDVFMGLKKNIEFKDVFFSFEGKQVLKGISFIVEKSEKIGIVGPTGVGKTTLVGLLLRFYNPEKGEILIDGKNIKEYKINSLRQHIGFVSQQPVLFHSTVKENITLGFENEERFKEVIKMDGIAQLINSLPEGENTIVGERGITLSGGQKQLISIARAIYKDPDILIFDEATSSLDTESEKMIQKAIDQTLENRTSFIIAHRLSTLKKVNKIIVLKDGTIVEEGTHQQLLDKQGVYYTLWQLQFA
ncbi:MAG TPA: ABC transporter ATP-binding protein [bacterium]|nr:ABC transporter ATP-binding protein [bacterium]